MKTPDLLSPVVLLGILLVLLGIYRVLIGIDRFLLGFLLGFIRNL